MVGGLRRRPCPPAAGVWGGGGGGRRGRGDGRVFFAPVDVQDVLLLAGGEVVPCGFDDGHDGEFCRAFGEFCGVFDSLVAVVAVVHGLCFSFFFSRAWWLAAGFVWRERATRGVTWWRCRCWRGRRKW